MNLSKQTHLMVVAMLLIMTNHLSRAAGRPRWSRREAGTVTKLVYPLRGNRGIVRKKRAQSDPGAGKPPRSKGREPRLSKTKLKSSRKKRAVHPAAVAPGTTLSKKIGAHNGMVKPKLTKLETIEEEPSYDEPSDTGSQSTTSDMETDILCDKESDGSEGDTGFTSTPVITRFHPCKNTPQRWWCLGPGIETNRQKAQRCEHCWLEYRNMPIVKAQKAEKIRRLRMKTVQIGKDESTKFMHQTVQRNVPDDVTEMMTKLKVGKGDSGKFTIIEILKMVFENKFKSLQDTVDHQRRKALFRMAEGAAMLIGVHDYIRKLMCETIQKGMVMSLYKRNITQHYVMEYPIDLIYGCFSAEYEIRQDKFWDYKKYVLEFLMEIVKPYNAMLEVCVTEEEEIYPGGKIEIDGRVGRYDGDVLEKGSVKSISTIDKEHAKMVTESGSTAFVIFDGCDIPKQVFTDGLIPLRNNRKLFFPAFKLPGGTKLEIKDNTQDAGAFALKLSEFFGEFVTKILGE